MQASVSSHTASGFTNRTYPVMVSIAGAPIRVEVNIATLSTTHVRIIGSVALLFIPDRDTTTRR